MTARTLVIDTAGVACSVALIEGARVLAFALEEVGRGHAERLLPMIAALPDGGRADRIMVDVGPGSFTGVRVGIAAARALGLAWGVPVTGYLSLALLAHGLEPCAVAIEGGHGQLFVADLPHGTVLSLTPETAAAQLRHHRVVGNAAQRIVVLRGHGEGIERSLDARDVAGATLPPLPPAPVYGRGADAKPMASA